MRSGASFLRRCRSETGSQGLEAAGAALAAALIVLAMLAGARGMMGPRVEQAFQCAASVLVGGGGGCGSGAADQPNLPSAQKASKEDGGGFGLLDGIQLGLDIVGLVPGFGEVADGINGVISLARGDEVGAALSFGAMIPFAGWGATGARWVRNGVRYSDEAAAAVRYGDEVAGAARYGDEAAGATSRRAEDILPPCPIGRAPGGKGPGLAAPMAAPLLTCREALARAQTLLDGAPGYNVSPEGWFGRYPTLGNGRSFISDKRAISDIIGDFEGAGDVVTISADRAAALERAMGLQPGSLADGFRISRVDDVAARSPGSPTAGNQYFLGPGNGLPGGGPELTIDPIPAGGGPGISQITIIVR
jgi:hypothetical protein